MVAATETPDSVGKQLERLGEGLSRCEVRSRGSGCAETKQGGESWPAGRTAASSSSCSAQQQLEKEKGDEEHGDVSGRR